MEKQTSLIRYKSIDLVIWTFLLGLFETFIAISGSSWFKSQPYTVSLVPALSLIVYIRWGIFGSIYSALGGLFLSLSLRASVDQTVVYVVGNLFSLLVYPLIVKVGKDRIRNSSLLSMIFAVMIALFMQIGRYIVSLFMGGKIESIIDFITTDALSGVFAVVIILIVRRVDGLFEDQISYLRRIEEENEEKR